MAKKVEITIETAAETDAGELLREADGESAKRGRLLTISISP
ncbi:MAG: hypothetical protein ACLS4Z_10020 [Christensenellaceae bacterium]